VYVLSSDMEWVVILSPACQTSTHMRSRLW